MHRCDVVYHLAAAVGVQLIVDQPGHTLLTNVQGTENVLEYCSRFGKRVLIASSSEVYGDHQEEQPLAEDARRIYGPTTARRWAYADTKAMDEFFALARHEEHELDCVIARLFNTVGPRQSGQYGMVIPRFVAAALAGEPLQVHGDGTQTRSFCHVHDSIRALKDLVDESATAGEIYNVGSQERITIGELARARDRDEREPVGDRARSLRAGLPARGNGGDVPSHPVDREDQGGDRVGTRARPRGDSRRRHRVDA